MVKIVKMDHKGRGICYLDKICFVSGAVVRDEVSLKDIVDKKKYYEAKVDKILVLSEFRIDPICPHFNVCGGCDYLHVSYEKELEFKSLKVKEIFAINLDFFAVDNIISGSRFNYRNKASFKKGVGFFKKNSNSVVEIDYCYLLDDSLNRYLKEKKNYDVVIRKNKDDYSFFETEFRLSDYRFLVGSDSFFQVNLEQAKKLYDIVKEKAGKGDTLVDLYAGVGSIGIYLSSNFSKVVCVELVKQAVDYGKQNIKLNNLKNVTFFNKDAVLFEGDADVVIVDPPRSGLKNVDFLIKTLPKKIIYISCDPMTLVRDLKKLDMYTIKSVTPVDMFPCTRHIEIVCELSL